MTNASAAIWAIAAASAAGVVVRPFRSPEWAWAVGAAALLLASGLVSPGDAAAAVAKGADVYLFLAGMMLLSEAARAEGVFDWIAAAAVRRAGGSGPRLFLLVYLTGVAVTTFLSNDATAVVLTPAVFAAARKAKADPEPLLLACALVANAASFVLPISNPANLVLYGGHMPALWPWLGAFLLPSVASILVTFAVLRIVERRRVSAPCAPSEAGGPLSAGGVAALGGVLAAATLLLVMSALDRPLGPPTALAGAGAALLASLLARRSPLALAREISWGVLPLVAGLFVVVEALERTGVIGALAAALRAASLENPASASAWAGAIVAVACNLMNNLPVGLVSASAIGQAHPPQLVVDGLLIGVDLGPNLSVAGSLATILWLQAIRREGEDMSFWRFLKIGLVAAPTALAAALAARLLIG
ncbi:SLC13 family permease [Methylocella sp.]|uniref:SLC13 family permease n=1 Tax=Methylocella sp. TaxID=1978226 RepID=UPI0035B443BC